MELFLNILNYLFVLMVLYFFYYNKTINLLLLLIFAISTLSVFFAGRLATASGMPDVIIYSVIAERIRSLEFDFAYSNLREFTGPLPFTKEKFIFDPSFNAAFILTAIPIPFIANYISLGFSNKLIYLLTFIFLHTKKAFSNVSFAMYLFCPSIVLYTSVGLKDTLVLVLSCLCGYFLVAKKYIYLLVCIAILCTFKYTNGVLLILTFISYFVLFVIKDKKLKNLIIIIGFIAILIFLNFFGYKIINTLDIIREAQWYADGMKVPYKLSFDIYLFPEILEGLLRFYLRPFIFEITNNQQLFQSMENIFVLVILFLTYINCRKINKNRALFWLLVLISMSTIYGLTVSNFGTITRYRFPLIMFYIFTCFYDCQLNAKKK